MMRATDRLTAALGLFAIALTWTIATKTASAQLMTLPGKFDVGPSGAAGYTIPISVPPGTAGMTPSLALEYNSQAGNGLVGVGWSLSGLLSIGRCPQTMVQDGVRGAVAFASTDRFCLDGQRLVAISGTYGADGAEYRTEVETFSRVISHGTAGNGPAWFEVHTKSGQVMEFGHTVDSLVLAQGKTTARNWALNKVSDSKGNYFTVSYTNDTTNGQAYPIEIDYTGSATGSLAPYNKVQFVYATRPDIVPAYQQGSLQQTTVRLTDVKTYAGANLVGDYKLAYQQDANSGFSEMTSVSLCDANASCLPATNFTWQPSTDGSYTFTKFETQLAAPDWTGWTYSMADVNGDGRQDIVGIFNTGSAGFYYTVAFSNGDGSYTLPRIETQLLAPSFVGWTFSIVDINGDGKADILGVYMASGGFDYLTALSNGDGTFTISHNETQLSGPSWAGWTSSIADVNGDGLPDIVGIFNSGSAGVYYTVAFSNGDGSYTLPRIETQLLAPSFVGWNFSIVDINGDGKADILGVYMASGGFDYLTALSNGDGTFTISHNETQLSGPSWAGWTSSIADVNGDGLPDIVGIFNSGSAGVYYTVAFSNGDGSYTLPRIETQLLAPSFVGWNFSIVDINGDGKADILGVLLGSPGFYYLSALSNGNGNFTISHGETQLSGPSWAGWNLSVADINGDGKPDLVGVLMSNAGFFYLTALTPNTQNCITSVRTGLGATTSITYQPLTNSSVYTKDSTAVYPLQDVQSPMYVVSRVDTTNGIGGTYGSTYSYAGAKIDLSGRGFLGFRQMTVTDLQTNIVHTTNYRQDFPFLGMTASETKALGAQMLNQLTATLQFSNASGAATLSTPSNTSAPYRISVSQRVAASFDLDGSVIPPLTTTFQYDAFGNATQVVTSTPDGYSKTTNSTYSNDTARWYLGRLTGATVTSTTP